MLVGLASAAALMAPAQAAGPSSQASTAGQRAAGTTQQPARSSARSLLKLAGVPNGWVPKRERTGDYVVRRAGAVVKDLRVNGDLIVAAPDVTLRRVEVVGGRIDNNAERECYNGLRIVRTTVRTAPGGRTTDQDLPAIGTGGYVARGIEIAGTAEGFRVGGASAGCGRVKIVDSTARVVAPAECDDWHGDGLQGYDGPALTIRNVSLSLIETGGCYGTAAFFYPAGQGNTSADVTRLRVKGGGYPFRLGTPGRVRGLQVVRGSWGYAPYDVACDALTAWRSQVVGADQEPRAIACQTDGGY